MRKTYCVALGDVHLPWASTKALRCAVELIQQLQPEKIVQVGDINDQYFASRYPKHFKLTPEEEFNQAQKQGAKLWQDVTEASPKSKRYQLRGNHDDRIYKKMADKVPELMGIIGPPSGFMQFPGVETAPSSRDALKLQLGPFKVIFVHGWLSKLGDHARHFDANVVCGHSHRPGIVYMKRDKGLIWEANAGYLGDENAACFKYGESSKKNWGLGALVIDDHGPRFVSFE